MQMKNAGHNFARETMIGVTMACFGWMPLSYYGACQVQTTVIRWNLGQPGSWVSPNFGMGSKRGYT
jgi:hypothetical protein